MKKIYLGLGALVASVLPFVAGAQTFDVPTSTQASLTANVTSQIAAPGVFQVIILAIGIPLFFYIVHQFMGLLPKSRARKS
jgi:hypothetical protein